jgi:hypothetical protein
LSFYVSVELNLFPGKTANVLQKSMVKCNGTFDKIREAYSEIFGYTYRPKPYSYKPNKQETNNQDTNKPEINKQDTNKQEINNPDTNKQEIKKVGGFNKTLKIKRK